MSRLDTLRLLVMAEIPTDLETIEASATEIARRLDDLDQNHALYWLAHRRLDELLAARDRAIAHASTP
jgi:hypothetical protein